MQDDGGGVFGEDCGVFGENGGGLWWFWFLWLKEIVVASVWGSRKVRDYIVLFLKT